ncbi:MAG: alkaline phosphatase D family protein [Bdellovibrionaceae bacterium]|nr:alkaline phosphatase D family protein [Pseudobdellovibrionaceae bacterium]
MRRDFLKGVLAGTAAWIAAPAKAVAQARNGTEKRADANAPAAFVPILQGATTSTTAQFSLLIYKDLDIRIGVSYIDRASDSAMADVQLVLERKHRDDSPWIAYKLRVSGLEPGRQARLDVIGSDGRLLDQREFSSLRDTAPETTRFVLASCMHDDWLKESPAMWDALSAAKPDFVFLLGDCVYVDTGPWSSITPERIWRRYVETRLTLGLYRWTQLIPVIATWDDHDFGKNDKDSRWGMKDASRAIFDAMYAQEPTDDGAVFAGPGIARGFHAYGHRFLVTDGRSFRSSRWARAQRETFWGPEQDAWIENELNASDAPAWLLNGTQYFGAYRSGLAWSFEGNHAARFSDFVHRIRSVRAPVVLGSGDVHFSELQKIDRSVFGYETYEITSSAMHSYPRSLPKGNPRRLAGTSSYNFCLIETRMEDAALRMDLTCLGAGSRELFKIKDLTVRR